VAVISDGFWKRSFARSPDALGRVLQLRGGAIGGAGTSGFEKPGATRDADVAALTIVGVAPPGFFGDSVGTSIDVWVPLMMQPALMPGRAWLTRNTASWVRLMGRLRPGVSEQQARASLTTLARQIRTDELGGSMSDEQRQSIAAMSIHTEPGARGFGVLRRMAAAPLVVLAVVVALVLLIACLNVANLLLARATARRHEIAMRLSLGASRGRLVRQLLTESLVLATLGGALGLVVAGASTQALVALVSIDGQPISLPFDADWRVLTFTAVICLASGLIFGLAPAWRGTAGALQTAMKDGSRTTGSGRTRLARTLVGGQVAVSLTLIIAAGLFLRTLHNLKSQVVGYDRTGLVVMRLDPIGAGYRNDAIGRACVELMHRFAAIAGVRSATFSENGLFSGTESVVPVEIDGFTPSTEDDRVARFDQVGPGYFTNVGIPLLLGRDLAETDRPSATRVAVINDTMARFYFGDRNPIGQHIRIPLAPDLALEIVGVSRSARDHSLKLPQERRFYVSYLQPIDGLTGVNFEIRAAGHPGTIFGPLRETVRQFDRNLQVLSLKTADSLIDDSIVTERMVAKLSSVFGALAVFLAAIGLYGVMAFTVSRRTTEIGLRMALGARRATVVWMILREIVGLVGAGLLAGVAAALALSRFVSAMMFDLEPTDPVTFVSASALLLLVGLLAGYLPARRASHIDPIVALRAE
jgi:predicted permease